LTARAGRQRIAPAAGRIARAFAEARAEGRAAFVGYLTAGDPDLETSEELVVALAGSGADVIELGVPFSDPIADGPINQRSALRALDAGTTLLAVLQLVKRLRRRIDTPLVLFTYFNPVHRRGIERFAREAAAAGVDGVLCLDLPPEEGRELRAALGDRGVDSVVLLAPTSSVERVRQAGRTASGFVYYVSRAGVTGERTDLAGNLEAEIRRVRRHVALPIAVGFGISTRAQVAEVGRLADGVVVGSALVRVIDDEVERAGGPSHEFGAEPARRARLLRAFQERVKDLLGSRRLKAREAKR
jgi:tryptophan synthase alpha chain